MSGFLLDTNVISMLSPSAAEASARFLEWLERMDSEGRVFLSVVAIHEIEKGIALLEHKGATAKAATLKAWLAGLVAAYDDKILALDASRAALAGQLGPRQSPRDRIRAWRTPLSRASRKRMISSSSPAT